MSSLEASDAAAAAVQKTPHRVTLEQLKAKIASEHYFTAGDGIAAVGGVIEHKTSHVALHSLTICVITTYSGFVLVGKSAPADPNNFNAELGKKFALEDATRQLWPLEGYLLREDLHQGRK